MLSDGKNLMLNSREEYRLWLLFKNLSADPWRFSDDEPEQILLKWINQFYDALEESHKNPMVKIELGKE